MIKKELFEKTVAILVKAYQNETLEHSNCYACAVGNLIAANCGYELVIAKDSYVNIKWRGVEEYPEYWLNLLEELNRGCVSVLSDAERGLAISEIEATGYTISEINSIELAFERREVRKFGEDKDGYLGLMSVIDTLMLIHEATPQEAESAKLQFVKA